jgi:predicted nucleotidyltransferase
MLLVSTGPRRVVDREAFERLRAAAERILSARPEVVAAYLYGSAARGEPAADLDVALLIDGEVDFRRLEALAALLEAEGAPAGPSIDVRPLGGTSPRFRASVISDGRLLYEADRERRLAFEARSLAEWLDFKPTWERMRRRMLDRWANG